MDPNTRATRQRRPFPIVLLVAVVLAAAWLAEPFAQQWPALRQGMWEFTRTMQPPGGGAAETITSKRCIDPVADMQSQNAKLARAGCTSSAPVRSGNTYTFTATCKMMGVQSNTKSTLVVESDSAYTLTVEGTAAGQPVNELMKARRTGDCSR
jgi:hypothetical protein